MLNKKGNWSSSRRKSLKIPIAESVLFIYCGKCTEPNYFESILSSIKIKFENASQGMTKFEYDGEICEYDPANMAKFVKDIIKDKNKSFTDVYVVFDKDSFEADNFDNAIKKINAMTNDECQYCALWSNECIELWFILHFEYLQARISRDVYFNKIGNYLGIKYEKNIKNIAHRIVENGGFLDKAINNSKKLIEFHKNEKSYSKKYPATAVYLFFEKYKNYI